MTFALVNTALKLKKTKTVQLLLSLGADVEAKRSLNDNATALMAAMAKNMSDMVWVLLNNGGDPHAADIDGTTAYNLTIKVTMR